jgi:hypothetical protein
MNAIRKSYPTIPSVTVSIKVSLTMSPLLNAKRVIIVVVVS